MSVLAIIHKGIIVEEKLMSLKLFYFKDPCLLEKLGKFSYSENISSPIVATSYCFHVTDHISRES